MDVFKKILTNTTTLLQTVIKTTATTIDVNLDKNNFNDNHLQDAIICLNDKSIFLPSIELITFRMPQYILMMKVYF